VVGTGVVVEIVLAGGGAGGVGAAAVGGVTVTGAALGTGVVGTPADAVRLGLVRGAVRSIT
jgi:hypothetical protein